MQDIYLRTDDEPTMSTLLSVSGLIDVDGTARGVAVDLIGTIYVPTEEGGDPVALSGYHANVRADLTADQLSALAPYRIYPASPTRVFAGVLAVPTVDEQRAAKWLEIKAARDRRKAGGVQVGGYWFHSDDASRIQQIGLVMMGANIPAGLQWKTMSGEFVTMTPELAQQIFDAVATHDQAAFAVAEQHCAAMEVSDGPANYDYSAGWPPIYGE